MGSPLALVLANLFMGHHERIWLQQHYGPAICFYRRYVDDTFCLFNNENDALECFHYINDRHPNIRFTMETEVNHKLPFLDVLLDNSNVDTQTRRRVHVMKPVYLSDVWTICTDLYGFEN